MTSPATNPGTVASGAVYRCTACGREFNAGPNAAVLLRNHVAPITLDLCAGVVIDIARDDRAGVTLPTAIQPVGGDQLEPGRVGQVEGESDAGGCGHENSMGTARATVTANACADGAQPFVTEAACPR